MVFSIKLLNTLILLLTATTFTKSESAEHVPIKVEIVQENGSFIIYRNGEPYFIKGARTLGTRYMEQVAEYGGNSVRVGYGDGLHAVLDRALELELTVLAGLPVRAERDGFDYSDPQMVEQQFSRIREIVEVHMNHPALLMWVIGNELDHIPGNIPYDLKMWNAVNDIAEMIQEIDPMHPVMTVIGTGMPEKLADLMERAPSIDLLGINAYADLYHVPGWLDEYGWNKPFAVTEWGPSGHWEVPRTSWGAVIEETSSEKGSLYKQKYREIIEADPRSVGSYAFLWTSNRMERTHTWYNMFYDDGSEKEAVHVMRYVWTGEWPSNRAPRIEKLMINGMQATDNITLMPGTLQTAAVEAFDPDGDSLHTKWELLPELSEFAAYAGQGETKPESIKGFIEYIGETKFEISFRIPEEAGKTYRLFVYVHDGNGNIGVANIPFLVREE
ncbi:MAG: hypothetical protein EA359_00490 [Balneolaceae bacterium]|nr:MAG: hypothetical protein EA359_00490 [Balneolaceae bacterium]